MPLTPLYGQPPQAKDFWFFPRQTARVGQLTIYPGVKGLCNETQSGGNKSTDFAPTKPSGGKKVQIATPK
jgi:hypothetical protein